MWTIYFNPKDHPGKYVTRKWSVVRGATEPVPAKEAFVAETLEQARGFVPAWATQIARDESDEPQVVESWI